MYYTLDCVVSYISIIPDTILSYLVHKANVGGNLCGDISVNVTMIFKNLT